MKSKSQIGPITARGEQNPNRVVPAINRVKLDNMVQFSDNNIQIDKVLSSEWCRCKDTAGLAFNNYETFKGLNSFYQEKFYKYKDEQIKSLKKYISNWNDEKNLILVTHFVVISEMLNFGTSSGEIVVIDKDYKFIGNIETLN